MPAAEQPGTVQPPIALDSTAANDERAGPRLPSEGTADEPGSPTAIEVSQAPHVPSPQRTYRSPSAAAVPAAVASPSMVQAPQPPALDEMTTAAPPATGSLVVDITGVREESTAPPATTAAAPASPPRPSGAIVEPPSDAQQAAEVASAPAKDLGASEVVEPTVAVEGTAVAIQVEPESVAAVSPAQGDAVAQAPTAAAAQEDVAMAEAVDGDSKPIAVEGRAALEQPAVAVERSPVIEVEEVPPAAGPVSFVQVLSDVIARKPQPDKEVNSVLQSNRARTKVDLAEDWQSPPRVRMDVIQYPIDDDEALSFSRLVPFLAAEFEERDEHRLEYAQSLSERYKQLDAQWQRHCKRLDKLTEKLRRRKKVPTTATPGTPGVDLQTNAPLLAASAATTPGAPMIPSRPNRRQTGASTNAFGYGDAVRSEAEFLEILASLESADMRDPTTRASRTAAVVPDMVLDADERRDLYALDEDERGLVQDPVAFYKLDAPLDNWTETEIETYCKRYAQYPKQFGKISSELSDKTTAQCVLFYYRMKDTIDFRGLSERRRDGRRKRPRRKGDGGDSKKGPSLLSNLQRAPPKVSAVEGNEEDTPPPSSPKPRRKGGAVSGIVADKAVSASSKALATITQENASAGNIPTPPANETGEDTGETQPGQPLPALPPSDGMMEAAEALGALAGFDMAMAAAQPAPTEIKPPSRSRNSGRRRSRPSAADKLDAAVATTNADGTAATMPAAAASAPPRRRGQSSSYWSVNEKAEFMRLLGVHGKNWTKIAQGLGNKSAVQCRNVRAFSPHMALPLTPTLTHSGTRTVRTSLLAMRRVAHMADSMPLRRRLEEV